MSTPTSAASELPQFVLVTIFKQLDLKCLLNAGLVCKNWLLASQSDDIWERLAKDTLWKQVSYVRFPSQLRDLSWKDKLKYSFIDSRRTAITRQELLAFEWLFRLKVVAPQVLRLLDPWHHEIISDPSRADDETRRPLLRRKFLDDGRFQNIAGDLLALYYEQWEFQDDYHTGNVIILNRTYQGRVQRTSDWGWMIDIDDSIYLADLDADGPFKYSIEGFELHEAPVNEDASLDIANLTDPNSPLPPQSRE